MPTMDVFNNDAFSLRSMTGAVQKAPYKPARIGQLGLFFEKGITTTKVEIEEKQGQLTLIQTTPRGGTGSVIGADARTMRALNVPHLQRESVIRADEVQGVRAFGTENEVQTVQDVVNDRLATLRQMHEVTLEHLRMGAIKGLVLDADLSTIYNLFTEFGVVQQTAELDFGTAVDVRVQCVDVLRLLEDALGAATYTRGHALCSPSFFDGLVSADQVKESFRYQEGQVLRDDLRRGFTFGGILWEEYRGKVGAVEFITDGEAYCFPEGAMTEKGPLFTTYFAPADFEETVNTMGQPIYARQAPDPTGLNRHRLVHTQSNPLPLCLMPRTVIKLTMAT